MRSGTERGKVLPPFGDVLPYLEGFGLGAAYIWHASENFGE